MSRLSPPVDPLSPPGLRLPSRSSSSLGASAAAAFTLPGSRRSSTSCPVLFVPPPCAVEANVVPTGPPSLVALDVANQAGGAGSMPPATPIPATPQQSSIPSPLAPQPASVLQHYTALLPLIATWCTITRSPPRRGERGW